MNFTQAVAQVVLITKRPDKAEAARREVNAAISLFCLGTNFARDLMEDTVTVSSSLYVHRLDLADFERFRKFLYIKPPGYCKPLDMVLPDKVFTQRGSERINSYYISGDGVVIKIGALTTSLDVGWFTHPPILTDDAPDFWLLDVSPYMIINKAAAAVFNEIGNVEESKKKEGAALLEYDTAKNDYKYGQSLGR